ncbi:MAG: GNAT family N-acetyltransferase, partial [Planctomycetota bacterium]
MTISICRATQRDLEEVVPLFDAYRQFYEQPSAPEETRAFLQARLTQDDSVLFLARNGSQPVGFTQLYPSWSSVRLRRVWILNDLYVAQHARR